MTQAKLTRAGHMLCLDQVVIPQVNQPGNPEQWVWWVLDPTGVKVVGKYALCYHLDDSEIAKAYSEAVYRLGEKAQGLIEFDELEWSP